MVISLSGDADDVKRPSYEIRPSMTTFFHSDLNGKVCSGMRTKTIKTAEQRNKTNTIESGGKSKSVGA